MGLLNLHLKATVPEQEGLRVVDEYFHLRESGRKITSRWRETK